MDPAAAVVEPSAARSAALAVEMRKVNKWYGEFHVLRDIDLEVSKGERIVVCGPSGSGKSTMIRCINRLEEHQAGHIFVEGEELTSRPITSARRCSRTCISASISSISRRRPASASASSDGVSDMDRPVRCCWRHFCQPVLRAWRTCLVCGGGKIKGGVGHLAVRRPVRSRHPSIDITAMQSLPIGSCRRTAGSVAWKTAKR